MKKLFTKNDSSAQQYVGKVFTVGRFSVTVEDVIAEGKIIRKDVKYIYIYICTARLAVVPYFFFLNLR